MQTEYMALIEGLFRPKDNEDPSIGAMRRYLIDQGKRPQEISRASKVNRYRL